MFQLDIIPTDTIPTVAQESSAIKNISFDQLIDTLISDMVHFAISLTIAILVFYAGKYIIALFASAGVAIGMALSGTLQNFAGGVLILLLKPFKVGDYIEAQGFAGTVTRIEIFNTIICTPDNKSIIIPNGGLSTGSINNYSIQPYRRVDWTVGISYGESVDRARTLLLDLLRKDPRILWEEKTGMPSVKAPVVVVAELADSSVNLSVRAWVASADYWGVYFDHNEEFYNAITAAPGLSFPFPQLDVHMTAAPQEPRH